MISPMSPRRTSSVKPVCIGAPPRERPPIMKAGARPIQTRGTNRKNAAASRTAKHEPTVLLPTNRHVIH